MAKSFHGAIDEQTKKNTDFRRVIFTGQKSQLVVMSIPPGDDVGEEVHEYVEQTLFFTEGVGEAILDGRRSPIRPGDCVVVGPGTRHNFRNTGKEALKLFTVYAPANHIDGRIHKDHRAAEADQEDEDFGHRVR